MVPNSAGGFSFPVDDWTRLERFLILGAEGGTYYIKERPLTLENAGAVSRCLASDPDRAVQTIAYISESGRAPKQDPAVFALALAAGFGKPDAAGRLPVEAQKVRAAALAVLPRVCRIGTDIFNFAAAVEKFRGWGPGLRAAVARWYTTKTADDLAFQLAKYQQRNGWSHRDLLRLSHAASGDPRVQAALRWAVAGADSLGDRQVDRSRGGGPVSNYAAIGEGMLPQILEGFEAIKKAETAQQAVNLIAAYRLPWECVPTQFLKEPGVWEALLAHNLPLRAMIRNLGRMSAIGLLTPFSEATKAVAAKLADGEYIRKSRLHPLALLIAMKTYSQGKGDKGKLTWQVSGPVCDALDEAFYLAFHNVVPSGKNTLMSIDISGSMSWESAHSAGSSVTAREGAGAMAMVTARTEPWYHVTAFSTQMVNCDISGASRLTDVLDRIDRLPAGGTDCAQPMLYATLHKLQVDTFIVYTDNETWAGHIHPTQALRQYREKFGRPAKLIVCGMASSGFSIADPNDAGMLDVVGMDSSTPAVMSDFARN